MLWWTDIPEICSDEGVRVKPLSGSFFTISAHVKLAEMRASEVSPSLAWVQSCALSAVRSWRPSFTSHWTLKVP